MKFQVTAILLATIAPFVAADYELRPSLNQRISNLRNKERKLTGHLSELEAAQTFFVPLSEKKLFDNTFFIINSSEREGAEGPVHSVISLSISSDGSKVYYDHWEDGYENDPMRPIQESTEIWGDQDYTNGCRPDITCNAENAALDVLNSGDSVVVENAVPLNHGAGTTFLYDGNDLIQALYPVAITRGAYPDSPGSQMAGAVEVFDTKQWGTEYQIPISQGLDSDSDAFEYVGLYFMASEDDTNLTIDTEYSFDGLEEIVLNKGESFFLRVIAEYQGATVTGSNRMQVTMVTGDADSTYELRWFSLRPKEEWSTQYLSPVGDSKAECKVVIYNPHLEDSIAVTYQTNVAMKTIEVPPNDIAYTDTIADGSACMLVSDQTFTAFALSDNVEGLGDRHDWGYPVLPVNMLTSMALIGWGYGCTQNECDYAFNFEARSVVWVSPVSSATFYVDYENDDIVDDTFDVEVYSSHKVTDPFDTDLSGAIIWATEIGTDRDGAQVAFAAAWGQDASTTFGYDLDALDLGTVVVPFTPIAATKTPYLVDDVEGDGVFGYGDTIRYEIELVNVGPSDIAAGEITITDTLDPNVIYVEGTTEYYDSDTDQLYSIPDDEGATPFPLDGVGIVSQADLIQMGIHYIKFQVRIPDTSFGAAKIYNTGTARVWDNTHKFENEFPLGGSPKSSTLPPIPAPTEEEFCE